jgi:hypothetical protein
MLQLKYQRYIKEIINKKRMLGIIPLCVLKMGGLKHEEIAEDFVKCNDGFNCYRYNRKTGKGSDTH